MFGREAVWLGFATEFVLVGAAVSVTVAAAPPSVIELPPPPWRMTAVVSPLVDGRSSAVNE
jgi:hypothetical protein